MVVTRIGYMFIFGSFRSTFRVNVELTLKSPVSLYTFRVNHVDWTAPKLASSLGICISVSRPKTKQN